MKNDSNNALEIPDISVFRKAAAQWNPFASICGILPNELVELVGDWVGNAGDRGTIGVPENASHDVLWAAGWWGCNTGDIIYMMHQGILKPDSWTTAPEITEYSPTFSAQELFAVQMHALAHDLAAQPAGQRELPGFGLELVPARDFSEDLGSACDGDTIINY